MSKGFSLKRLLKKPSLKQDNEQSNRRTLEELCTYLLFLTVTTIITLSVRNVGMFYFNDTVDRIFIQRSTDSEGNDVLQFADLLTVDDWWTYVGTIFMEGVDSFVGVNSTLGLVIGGNMLLGPPRLRQIRVKNESCNVNEAFKNDFTTCYGEYSYANEDTDEYFGRRHSDRSELDSYSLRGIVEQYRGGGYVEGLTYDREKNDLILAKLKTHMWIDSGTRAVLLELPLFNVNVNLFCNVKLIAEIPATGGLITSTHLQSLKFSPMWNEGDYFEIMIFVAFVGLIAYLTLDIVRDVLTFGYISSMSSFFKLCNIAILLIAYSSIAYTIWHIFQLKSLLIKYSENKDEYISLDIICFWNLIFIDTMGICVFIVWIQIFKYIKFNKTMLQFSTTLQRCSKDLLGFGIMFVIVLTAYAYLSILFFGSKLAEFHTFSSAFLTLIRMVLGDFDYDRLEKTHRLLGPIFFLTFILSVFLILMNMFLAIINETYTDVKSDSPVEEDNEFQKYIVTLLKRMKNFVITPKEEKSEAIQGRGDSKAFHTRSSRRSKRVPEPSAEMKFDATKELLESLFEILPMHKDSSHGLNERVALVEQKMDKLIKHLDLIMKLTKKDNFNRSL